MPLYPCYLHPKHEKFHFEDNVLLNSGNIRPRLHWSGQIFEPAKSCTDPPFVYTRSSRTVQVFERMANCASFCNRIWTVPGKRVVLVKNSSVQKFVRTRVNWVLIYLQTSSWAILSDNANVWSVHTCTKEPGQIWVMHVTNLWNRIFNIFAVIIDFGNTQGYVNFLICKCSECF